MSPGMRRGHPRQSVPPSNLALASVRPTHLGKVDDEVDGALDVDALVVDLDGALVVRVVVNDDGQTRDAIFRSSEGGERAVRRAEARGRSALVLLCRLQPVGLVML